jgi:hypothetical protein
MQPTVGLDMVTRKIVLSAGSKIMSPSGHGKEKKIPCHLLESNPSFSVIQLVVYSSN